ncbi:MAG: hypothetical protein WED15_07420 [Akkermansiaceae bacterium]
MTIFPRIIALIAACLLVSCIDGHEEVWLETNGSGRAEISYSLPKAAARFQGGEAGVSRMIAKFLAENPAILASSHRVSTEGEQLKIFIQVRFDAAREFKDTKTLPSSAAAMAGEVKIHTRSRTVDFERRISPGSALPGAAFLPASSFQGRSLRYTLHLPVAARESNATRSENSGRTLIWDFPLAAAIRTPITTRFVVKMPLSPWLIAAVAPTLLLAGGLAFLGTRRLRQTRHPVKSP